MTSSVREVCGQLLKSVVAKPVVVMMDATWKAAWRRVSRKDRPPLRRSHIRMAMAVRMMMK